MRSLHRAFTGGEEEIDVRYISSVSIASYANEELIYSRFVEDLKSIEGDEISRAHSLLSLIHIYTFLKSSFFLMDIIFLMSFFDCLTKTFSIFTTTALPSIIVIKATHV